jgi:hypothetical protein
MVASLLMALTPAFLPYVKTPWAATLIVGVAMAGVGGLFALNTADTLARILRARSPPVRGSRPRCSRWTDKRIKPVLSSWNPTATGDLPGRPRLRRTHRPDGI